MFVIIKTKKYCVLHLFLDVARFYYSYMFNRILPHISKYHYFTFIDIKNKINMDFKALGL